MAETSLSNGLKIYHDLKLLMVKAAHLAMWYKGGWITYMRCETLPALGLTISVTL